MTWGVVRGDALEVLRRVPDASMDALVTDPPAGISFMGKAWDGDKGGRKQWTAWLEEIMREALRVLKPGAHGLVWALPRTSHWTATALEDAGFEVRDVITHLFGTGFPKSLDFAAEPGLKPRKVREEFIGTGLEHGWGTALKPASEHWILVRKPLIGTVAANALAHGTGGINVDACRIAHASPEDLAKHEAMVEALKAKGGSLGNSWKNSSDLAGASDVNKLGRWPANVILSHTEECRLLGSVPDKPSGWSKTGSHASPNLAMSGGNTERAPKGDSASGWVEQWVCADDCPVAMVDAQSGNRPGMSGGGKHAPGYPGGMFGVVDSTATARGDTGGASRFFYVAKPTTSERDAGCEHLPKRGAAELVDREEGSDGINNPRAGAGRTSGGRSNHHPTVKGIGLMRRLTKLVTPPGGTVLDPFCGSGSTGCACALEGFNFVGIEKEVEFVEIAKARILHWEKSCKPEE